MYIADDLHIQVNPSTVCLIGWKLAKWKYLIKLVSPHFGFCTSLSKLGHVKRLTWTLQLEWPPTKTTLPPSSKDTLSIDPEKYT